MTSEVPQAVLVMISDEAAAGRIVVDLGAFVRWNVDLDRQLAALEERMHREIPQLASRGLVADRRRQAGPLEA